MLGLSFTLASCSEDETEALIAPSVVLNKIITASSDELKVIITPSETTIKYEYAIGGENDLDAFLNGSLAGIKEVEGNSENTVIFSNLEASELYVIYARAYSESDVAGPLAMLKSKTRNPLTNFSVEQQYLTDQAVAYTITPTNEYYKFDFAIGKAVDKEAFEAGVIDGFTTKEDFSKYTANFFDLDSDTEYIFFIRGYDRLSGLVSETHMYELRTKEKGTVAAVDFRIDYLDLYSGDYTLTPNEHCHQFAVFFAIQDEAKDIMESELNWQGDIVNMMQQWVKVNNSAISFSAGGPLNVSHHTPLFLTGQISDPFEYPMEAYVLLIDTITNFVGVQRHSFASASYNNNVKEAKVSLTVSNITENGAFYEFTPNEHTIGFFYETFAADIYDEILRSPDYYDGYFRDYLFAEGYWYYCHKTPTVNTMETQGDPGKRYYVIYIPVNYNGASFGGWGEVNSFMYQTKQKDK